MDFASGREPDAGAGVRWVVMVRGRNAVVVGWAGFGCSRSMHFAGVDPVYPMPASAVVTLAANQPASGRKAWGRADCEEGEFWKNPS